MHVLFVNHKKFRCGVQQFGKLIANALSKHAKMDLEYLECESEEEFLNQKPETFGAIIYNYHDQTMKWLCNAVTEPLALKGVKQFCITGHDHFANFEGTKNIVPDPTGVDDDKTFYTGRLLPFTDLPEKQPSPVPIIGSFGFGFYQKNFAGLISLVNQQFDEAVIRLHIPANDFADIGGYMAGIFLMQSRDMVKPGITFEASHDFLERNEMVAWLSKNDINLFVYDDQPGRGISSAIDFALAARRPIGISKSSMFRHIYHDERILVDKTGLKDIIDNGTEPLEEYFIKWSPEALAARYDEILSKCDSSAIEEI